MKARIVDFSMSFSGNQRLTLELGDDFRGAYDDLKSKELDVTIKPYRAKRSLDANAYAWVLIDKIASKMRLAKTDVYRDHIRELGGVSDTVCVQNRAADRLKETWSKQGLGWLVETSPSKLDGCTVLTLYYGSSSYDTEQMSALIDSLIQTCQSLGIETMPEEQIESLIRSYR